MSTQHTAISAQARQAAGFAAVDTAAGWIFSALAKLRRTVATRYRMRRDIRELQSLSDASLRDIGIHRSEIISLVRHEHYGLVDHRYARF